jgi:AcrR family transcriptional regulator
VASSTDTVATPRRKARNGGEAARASLTPETWIGAATDVLVDQGIDHVRVDLLAQHLGVTRGSFYWHFKDREDLLRRVLQAWRETATENLTARLESAHEDPLEQLRDVLSLPFRGRAAARAARIELAIRAWARRDQMVSALGFPVLEARSRAFLLYSYVVSESQMASLGSQAQKDERRHFAERLFMQRLA